MAMFVPRAPLGKSRGWIGLLLGIPTRSYEPFPEAGENVALFGEVDLENENRGNLQEVSVEEILELHQQVTARKDELERRKSRAMRERGLIPHQDVPDDLYF